MGVRRPTIRLIADTVENARECACRWTACENARFSAELTLFELLHKQPVHMINASASCGVGCDRSWDYFAFCAGVSGWSMI